MSEKTTREVVVRMAHESGFAKGTEPHSVVVRHSNGSWVGVYAELNVFAYKVIEHFLDTTGQYVTNDASREAAIQAAVEAERSETAQLLRVDAGYVFEDECSGARDAVNYCVSLVEARRGTR